MRASTLLRQVHAEEEGLEAGVGAAAESNATLSLMARLEALGASRNLHCLLSEGASNALPVILVGRIRTQMSSPEACFSAYSF